jgi:hypothetical protein
MGMMGLHPVENLLVEVATFNFTGEVEIKGCKTPDE